MKYLELILSPPRFDGDPEKTRQARLLHVVSLVLIFLLVGLLVFNMFFDIQLGDHINDGLVGLILLQISAQMLIRRGHVQFTGLALMFLSWAGISWIAFTVESLRVITLFAYFTIILGSGFLFGWRGIAVSGAGSILAVWGFALYQPLNFSGGSSATLVAYLTALFILASVQIQFVIGVLRKSLKDADQELRERQHIEGVLIDERENLSIALEAAKMETWSWNIETGTVSWSAGIEAMFGMENGRFDGRYDTYLSLIHPEDLPVLQQAISQALSDVNFHYVINHRLVRPNGEVRWLEGRGKVYRNASGRPIRMAGTVVDVTERKQNDVEREHLIQELAAKNTELEQFTYTVSHDLKAPIITIKGFLGYLEEDALNGRQDRLHKDIARINDAVGKMHLLLNELLELSRIGRMMNPPEPVNLNILVREAVELLQGRISARSVKVTIMDGLPVVHGDRRRLLEVIQNLIDNAAKFMGAQTEPLIEIGQRGYEKGLPVFFVRDNGMGIAPEHHERIFGLFNKLDPLAEGTGIGLALVRRIVEFHGGRIWVQSEAGQGATFMFTLPVSDVLQR